MNTREILELELEGASQRVRLAQRTLEDFLQEHAGVTYSAELARSLDHERESLECELDAAIRRHKESLLQFEELKDRERVNI